MHMASAPSMAMHPLYYRLLILVLVIQVLTLQHSFVGAMAAIRTTSGPSHLSTAILIRVDQSGQGDYKKIQDAIDAVPANNTKLYFIWVKPGTYREKVVVPADKPFITISGSQVNTTVITWGDSGDIFESSTFSVLASDFIGRYLTIQKSNLYAQNTFGSSERAVALRVSGDKAAFYGCRILSYQDTLLDDAGRHYYSNCYIEGATDFICGNAASLFEKCRINSLSEGGGAITAQRRMSPDEATGFTFLGCRITGNGSAALGRPWGDYSRVVFAYSYMAKAVVPQGWNDWGGSASGRVKWSKVLTDDQVAPFVTKEMIGSRAWLRPLPTRFHRGSPVIAQTAPTAN
ncbi:hypothetical protein Sjap_010341 [Stephania japonica]|uniref:pectinesterase n=1 Tax=Stephania japonica TaxID=461633 RepID=A0AAP0J980_9MAGN